MGANPKPKTLNVCLVEVGLAFLEDGDGVAGWGGGGQIRFAHPFRA